MVLLGFSVAERERVDYETKRKIAITIVKTPASQVVPPTAEEEGDEVGGGARQGGKSRRRDGKFGQSQPSGTGPVSIPFGFYIQN